MSELTADRRRPRPARRRARCSWAGSSGCSACASRSPACTAAVGDLVEVAGPPAPVLGRGRRQRPGRARPACRSASTTGLRVGDPVRAHRRAAADPRSARSCAAGSSTASAGRSTAARRWRPATAGHGRATPRRPRCSRPRIDRAARARASAPSTRLTPCGRGQRLGIMAGSGVGKSSLLSMVARGTDAEVSVIALVGERGREVREFIENDLGPEGLARSVVVVATSDAPPVERLRAAFVATRIAEWFRDSGRHVVLMMDSLTRVAMAQREIGLSAGEPPATRGYPPSVFALLPRLLERAGTSPDGQHHRALHRAGRGRRPAGPDRRHRPLDPRRPRRALPPARDRRPLPQHRRPRVDLPGRRGGHRRPSSAPTPPGCAGCWPRTARCASWSRSAPTSPAPTPTPTPRWPGCPPSTSSCARTWTTSPPPPTPGAAARAGGLSR